MIRNLSILVFVLLIVGAGAAVYWFAAIGEVQIKLTAEDIESELQSMLPIKREVSIFEIEFYEVDVQMRPDKDKMRVEFKAELAPRETEGVLGFIRKISKKECEVTMWTDLGYDPDEQKIQLKDAEFDQLDVPGLSPDQRENLRNLSSEIAQQVFNKRVVKRIGTEEEAGWKMKAAQYVLKDLDYHEGYVVVTLGL